MGGVMHGIHTKTTSGASHSDAVQLAAAPHLQTPCSQPVHPLYTHAATHMPTPCTLPAHTLYTTSKPFTSHQHTPGSSPADPQGWDPPPPPPPVPPADPPPLATPEVGPIPPPLPPLAPASSFLPVSMKDGCVHQTGINELLLAV